MLCVSERGGAGRDDDEDTYNVENGIERWEHHGFRVRHFLLKLEDCRVDFVKEPTRNDDETPLYKFINQNSGRASLA
jgi:hypothetical protein